MINETSRSLRRKRTGMTGSGSRNQAPRTLVRVRTHETRLAPLVDQLHTSRSDVSNVTPLSTRSVRDQENKQGLRTIEGIGYVEPSSEIVRLIPPSGGLIEQCVVEPGEHVKKSQLIARMRSSMQSSKVALAKERVKLAQAKLAHVERGVHPLRIELEQQTLERRKTQLQFLDTRLSRIQTTFNRNVSSREELDSATNEKQQAALAVAEQELTIRHLQDFVRLEEIAVVRQDVCVAEASLCEAQQSLDETEHVAPFDGTVLRWLKKEGEGTSSVSPEPILLFGDLSRMHVRADVDERFAALVRKGMVAEVYGTNLKRISSRGIVVKVEPVMGDKSVFSQSVAERKGLDVLQVVIEMESSFVVPSGLRVDVRLFDEST